jgi:hypothetical protein
MDDPPLRISLASRLREEHRGKEEHAGEPAEPQICHGILNRLFYSHAVIYDPKREPQE